MFEDTARRTFSTHQPGLLLILISTALVSTTVIKGTFGPLSVRLACSEPWQSIFVVKLQTWMALHQNGVEAL